MSNAAPIAVVGFTPFERSTFEAFFRLASRRTPAYRLEADVGAAEFMIVDGDDPVIAAQMRAQGLLRRCVMLGAVEHAGAALQLARPINLMLLVRSLDALPRHTEVAAEAVAAAVAWPAVQRLKLPPVVPGETPAATPVASLTAGAAIRIPIPAPSAMPLAAPTALSVPSAPPGVVRERLNG